MGLRIPCTWGRPWCQRLLCYYFLNFLLFPLSFACCSFLPLAVNPRPLSEQEFQGPCDNTTLFPFRALSLSQQLCVSPPCWFLLVQWCCVSNKHNIPWKWTCWVPVVLCKVLCGFLGETQPLNVGCVKRNYRVSVSGVCLSVFISSSVFSSSHIYPGCNVPLMSPCQQPMDKMEEGFFSCEMALE